MMNKEKKIKGKSEELILKPPSLQPLGRAPRGVKRIARGL